MSAAERRASLINRIARFPGELESSVAGLSRAQLDFQPAPGEWSVRQIVHHLADSHTNAYLRMKLALTEEDPTIKPYDQEAFAELPDSKAAPLDLSLPWIRALHERWVYLMQALDPTDWMRSFQHPESGAVSLASLLESYAEHCDAHLDQIARAKAAQGAA